MSEMKINYKYLTPQERVNFLRINYLYGNGYPRMPDDGDGIFVAEDYYHGANIVLILGSWSNNKVHVMADKPLPGMGEYRYKGMETDGNVNYYFLERYSPNPNMSNVLLEYVLEWNGYSGDGYMYERKYWKR